MRVRTFHVNFFLDKNELSHLEKICKESGLGKSEVIRNLVIYHMNQDEILLRGRIGKVSLKGEADEKDT